MKPDRSIALIDCHSFYASVEHAAYPEYDGMPVAIGDPERRSEIILAACPIAKKAG
jgi:nucleotidyltransferase/DNA polymerase involved in DNA repair